ncbi:MAG: exodeoxyribonuclease VII small subunit [Candidatus Eremiobacter antarcticus]|nr:exodeoxyribonuclease VII small subunit [Candidatus Eremiobacteraeota bacterium]MBC5807441.1 exodeoxyribonuclease VII small subunit [Candidatus Eremiobacteraeota bacterium]PZR63207.1 MAG: exodeoxyribonuclease VII small subunit [Candidatus Eremiobacter sp. RRmetagenome_bin22]
MAAKAKPQNFEEALGRLEEIVNRLDDGNLPLADSLELFKEGTRLAAFCRRLLSEAELSVQAALEESKIDTESADTAAEGEEFASQDDLGRDDSDEISDEATDE